MNQPIAFIGLGLMGGHMAANLAKGGYEVNAWNRSPNRPGVEVAKQGGVNVFPSLEAAVENAQVILVCVGDIPDVEEVILGSAGVIQFASPSALVVDMSTIGATAAQKIGRELEQEGLRFLDAPISGGDIGAEKGTLTIMVGGKEKDFQEARPLFEVMGKNIHLCGPVGSGQAVKLCNQVLCSVHMVALCEAMKMAQQQGIDPNLIVEVCSTGAAGSWALANLGSKIIEENYSPGFAIKHMVKDLRLVRESLAQAGLNLPGVDIAESLFKVIAQMDEGKGEEQGTQAMMRSYLSQET